MVYIIIRSVELRLKFHFFTVAFEEFLQVRYTLSSVDYFPFSEVLPLYKFLFSLTKFAVFPFLFILPFLYALFFSWITIQFVLLLEFQSLCYFTPLLILGGGVIFGPTTIFFLAPKKFTQDFFSFPRFDMFTYLNRSTIKVESSVCSANEAETFPLCFSPQGR